jgi:predicted small metal-binding protein
VGEVVRCDCGYEVRVADEEGLVAAIQWHAREAHDMPLSDEEALVLASRAQAGPDSPESPYATRAEGKEKR